MVQCYETKDYHGCVNLACFRRPKRSIYSASLLPTGMYYNSTNRFVHVRRLSSQLSTLHIGHGPDVVLSKVVILDQLQYCSLRVASILTYKNVL